MLSRKTLCFLFNQVLGWYNLLIRISNTISSSVFLSRLLLCTLTWYQSRFDTSVDLSENLSHPWSISQQTLLSQSISQQTFTQPSPTTGNHSNRSFDHPQPSPTTSNSTPAFAYHIVSNPIFHKRTKHIEVEYYGN